MKYWRQDLQEKIDTIIMHNRRKATKQNKQINKPKSYMITQKNQKRRQPIHMKTKNLEDRWKNI